MATGLMSTMRLMGLRALIGLIVLMGFMSCSSSSDDAVEEPSTPVPTEVPISFSGSESQEEVMTRAAGKPLSEKATSFAVWGHKNLSYAEATGVYGTKQLVFPGYEVDWETGSVATTTTNSNGWEYILTSKPDQTIKYWDFSAKAYRFFGVTGTKWESGDWTIGQYKTNDLSDSYEITLNANASSTETMNATPYFSKLWFSTGVLPTYADKQFGKPVQLEFLKPYARVRFLFKYVYPREGIKLADISFKPTEDVGAAEEDKVKIARKGTVTVHYPKEGKEMKEWYTTEVDADKSTRLAALTVDYDPEDDGKDYVTLSSGLMTSEGWYMVLPNNTQGSYTLSVKVNGDAKKAVVPEQYMQWLPGYSYTYVFKITSEGGVEIGWVEYAVTPWTELVAEHTVYNW